MTSARLGSTPFVLLDDQRRGGDARLYARPIEIVETREPDEIGACMKRLADRHAAGFISYEAGHALEAKLAPLRRRPARHEPPLLWFGLFEECEAVDAAALLPDPEGAWAGTPRPLIERSAYEAKLASVHRHIEAGDIYQANLTFPAEVRFAGHPLALYAGLRRRAGAGQGAVVFTGEHWILSCSPELFFTLEHGRIVARPMKGTAARRADPAEDRQAASVLREDPKQRAENLMIVDLLRNDLSRVSKPGTVAVTALFAVETYPTVHQMTSTVTSELDDGADAATLLGAIFPCGSITGAPKIRAMEIIAGLEEAPRGVYCGAIGRLAPNGEAGFNVAIRTLVVTAGECRATLGLGSAIVADSSAAEEWRECLAKGAFVADPARSFDLIETMRFDPQEGVAELERHLERLKRSAEALGFAFDRHHARNELQAATFRLPGLGKVRLMLSPTGAIAIEIRPLEPLPPEPVEVAIAPRRVAADDFRLGHKTSDRAFYDAPREASGAYELVFTDEEGFLTEGSFTNLFVERDGRLLTPPLARGLLQGILREQLIAEGRAREADLTEADLAGGFLIGNSVRGLIRARLRS